MDLGVLGFVGKVAPMVRIRGKEVLEVGSRNVNGSARSIIERYAPGRYVGVDTEDGDGVDEVMSAHRLESHFGKESFDVVLSTEMLEHVADWRGAVSAMKTVLRELGSIILTTKHWGFPYHGYPHDYWRFEVIDLMDIFSDFTVVTAEAGPEKGAYIWAFKPPAYQPNDLSALEMRPIGNYGRRA